MQTKILMGIKETFKLSKLFSKETESIRYFEVENMLFRNIQIMCNNGGTGKYA